jgi:hypothetical protein
MTGETHTLDIPPDLPLPAVREYDRWGLRRLSDRNEVWMEMDH